MADASSEIVPGLFLVLVFLMQLRYWHMRLRLTGVIRDLRRQLAEARGETEKVVASEEVV